uniref:hypothetical protein n=1 Tax=Streptomyces sp. DSM 41540 TaxID=3448657 RepID=UPI00403FEDBC
TRMVNQFPAQYFDVEGLKQKPQRRYVFVLQLPGRLAPMTVAAQPEPNRWDAVEYLADETIQQFYRYGDPVAVREVFTPQVLDCVAALPDRVREHIRIHIAGTQLAAATSYALRAENFTAVFLALNAIATAIPATRWQPD